MDQFIAHRNPADDTTHSLRDHLKATGGMAAAHAGLWGAGSVARLAEEWHYLGKYAAS